VALLRQTLPLVPEGKPEFLCDSTPPLVGIHPKELETGAQTNACARRVRTAKTQTETGSETTWILLPEVK